MPRGSCHGDASHHFKLWLPFSCATTCQVVNKCGHTCNKISASLCRGNRISQYQNDVVVQSNSGWHTCTARKSCSNMICTEIRFAFPAFPFMQHPMNKLAIKVPGNEGIRAHPKPHGLSSSSITMFAKNGATP